AQSAQGALPGAQAGRPGGHLRVLHAAASPPARGVQRLPQARDAARGGAGELEPRGLPLPRRVDRGLARPGHPQSVAARGRIHPGGLPQPLLGHRRPASRPQTGAQDPQAAGGIRCGTDRAESRVTSQPHVQQLRRRHKLKSTLGLGETLLASADERRFAVALEDGLLLVEEVLLRGMSFADNLADVTARYLFEAGGKRVRPTLVLLTAQLGQGNIPEVIVAAEAMEMTHLASLYHDDVMDDADVRRGIPSAQTVWGNSVAILTGDLLFARSGRLIAGLG